METKDEDLIAFANTLSDPAETNSPQPDDSALLSFANTLQEPAQETLAPTTSPDADLLAFAGTLKEPEPVTPPPPSAAVQSVTAGARVLPEHQAPPSDATLEERQAWRRREMAQVTPVETMGSTIEKLPGGIREAAKVGMAANALGMGAVKGIAPFGLGEKIPLPDVSDMPLAAAMEAGGKLLGNLASFVIPSKAVVSVIGRFSGGVKLVNLAQSGHRGAKVVLHGLQTVPTFVAQGQLQAPITTPAADRAKIAGESALSGLMFSAAGALGEIPVVGKYVAPTALLGIAAQQSQNMTQFAENAFLLLGLHLMGVNSVVRKRMVNEAKQTMTGLGVPKEQAERIVNDAKTVANDPPPNLVEIRNRAEAQRLAEIEATKAAKQSPGAPIPPDPSKVPAPAPIEAPAPVPAMETARPEPLQPPAPTPLPPQPAPTPSGVPVGKEVPSAGTVIVPEKKPVAGKGYGQGRGRGYALKSAEADSAVADFRKGIIQSGGIDFPADGDPIKSEILAAIPRKYLKSRKDTMRDGHMLAWDEVHKTAMQEGLLPENPEYGPSAMSDLFSRKIQRQGEVDAAENARYNDAEQAAMAQQKEQVAIAQSLPVQPVNEAEFLAGDMVLMADGQWRKVTHPTKDTTRLVDGTDVDVGSFDVVDIKHRVSKGNPAYPLALEKFKAQTKAETSAKPALSLESPTPEQLATEATKRAQSAELERRSNASLAAKPIDTTGDLFDPNQAENPLFAVPTPKPGKVATPPPLPLTEQLAAGTPVTPPKTAAFLRVTDAKDNEQVVAAKDADTLKGAGPFKTAEWGNRSAIGKREFVPLEKATVAEPSIRELKAEADDMELPTAGGSTALKERIGIASKVRAPRRRGILSKTGAAGLPKEMRLGDKTSAVDKEALEVEAMFDWQDEQIRQKFKPTWQKTKDALRSATWAVDEPIQRRLERAEGGRDVLMARGKLRGVSAKMLQDYKAIEDAITRTLPEEIDKNFGRILQAKRTIEATKLINEDRGRQPELELDMADTLKSTKGIRAKHYEVYLNNLKRLYPEQWAAVEKALAIRYAANETLVDRMVEHDLISAEFGDYLKKNHKNYSQRWFIDKIDPDLPSSAPGGTPTSVPDSGVKKLDRGSEGAMISNWRTLLADQVARTEGRIAKNDVNRSLYDWAKATPGNALGVTIAPPGIETAPSGKAAIRVMIKGQPVTMFMPSELAQYWTNADPIIRGQAATILQWVSGVKPLKATATGLLAPEFALVNMPMDFFYKWFGGIGEYSSFLPKFVAQSMADYKATARDAATSGPRVKAYIDEYGGMDFLSKAGLFGERKPWEVGVNPAMETLRQVETLLSSPSQISEMWGRLAFRERALKNITAKRGARIEDATPQERFEATQKARNTLDFGQGGTAVKALDNVMAYLSAGVQGGRGILRAFRTRPVQATWQAAQLMAVAGALTCAWRKVYGDLYDKIPLFDRVGYWIVPIMKVKDGNGEDQLLYARIRKDQAVRVFAAIGDAFADKVSGKDIDGSLVREAMAEMNPAGMSTITSPTLSALLSYSANKDFWRNKDIWRGARVSPEMEVNRDTPAWLAAGAGKLAEKTGISISPERSRVAAQRVIAPNLYTGTLGVLADTVMPDNPDMQKTMLEKIVRLPGARKILKMTKTYELTKRQEGLASRYKIDRTQPHSQIVKQIEAEERAEADAKQSKRVGYWKEGREPPEKKTTTLPRGPTVRMPR